MNQRDFTSFDVSRSHSRSEPASDLTERVLLALSARQTLSEEDLISEAGGDAHRLRAVIETLVNLKLINLGRAGVLQISDSGKIAIASKLLSISD
jgi:hypothetical protein